MAALEKPTPHNYRVYLLEVMLTLLRTARDMNADVDILGENNATLNALMREPDMGKATSILKSLSGRLQDAIQTGRASATANLAHQAEAYLNEHFTDADMSVELLCRELHVSASYFSAIYKQEKKETFHQTLTRLRMDLSMQLLTTTTKKTTEIAQCVGLADPSYFSHAFKRYFGVSPSQARTGKGVEPCMNARLQQNGPQPAYAHDHRAAAVYGCAARLHERRAGALHQPTAVGKRH